MIDIDLLIFDVDGTLIDSRKDIAKAVNHTLKRLGLKDKSFDEVVSYIVTGMRDLMRRSLGEGNLHLLEKGLDIFKDFYRVHSADETRPYPNVIETLEYFKDKTKAVVSNRDRQFAELTLRLLGLDKYFKRIVGGDDERCIKPMACPLDNILKDFGTDKKKAVIIGDMDLDIISGKNAGVVTCGVTYGIGRPEDILKAEPDFVIDDMSELRGIVKK